MREQYPLNSGTEHLNACFVQQGEGRPVILIHGLAASHHDWDALIPALAGDGYAAFALDLLGHGDSAKPPSRAYRSDWLVHHLSAWIESLNLREPAVLIGHSLGGYLSLEYAHSFPERVRGLILVSPFYRLSQLPALLRFAYRRPMINTTLVEHTPEWLFRLIVDSTSLSMGHSSGGAHGLPAHVRAQTTLDYLQTAAGVYNLPNTMRDLTPRLQEIRQPAMLIWGARDSTLSPSTFEELVSALPNVIESHALPSGHVPHQSHPDECQLLVQGFLRRLDAEPAEELAAVEGELRPGPSKF